MGFLTSVSAALLNRRIVFILPVFFSFFLAFSFFSLPLSGQNESNANPPQGRPSGTIKPPSPEASMADLPEQGYPLDLLRDTEGKSGKLTLTLRYQGDEGDYLVFYGRRGEPLYLRYREDRFDFRTRQIAENLLPGRIYRVSFQYPEAPQKERTPGRIRPVIFLKKGVYLSSDLFLPESFRF